jgi:hypothetical protein
MEELADSVISAACKEVALTLRDEQEPPVRFRMLRAVKP